MKIYYREPKILEDGRILVEQISESHEMILPHGITKIEVLIAKEYYPSKEILELALERAEKSYHDVKLQGQKSVMHLEMEKSALAELQTMVNKLDFS